MSEGGDSLQAARQHCEGILAAAADDWVLARLFLPQRQRDAATALLALRHELRRVPGASEEPGVVAVKLNWWREEIGRAASGTANHPVLQLLAASGEAADIDPEYLLELADAAEMEFDAGAIRDEADRRLYLYRSSGVVAELFARMACGLDREQLRVARSIGMARGQLDIMQQLAIDIGRNCLRIPLDALAANEIAPAALAEADAARRNSLLQGEREQLDQLRIEARTMIARCEPAPALRVIWRRLEQDYRRLPQPLSELTVTPAPMPGMLRRLWTAWRAARRPIN